MSWEKHCEENASAPSGDGWLLLAVAVGIVVGVIVLIVVL